MSLSSPPIEQRKKRYHSAQIGQEDIGCELAKRAKGFQPSFRFWLTCSTPSQRAAPIGDPIG
jgi:hypothetical protein